MHALFTVLAFEAMRHSLAGLMRIILGIVAVVLLGVSTVHVVNGDQEGGKKFIRWFVGVVFGFILISVIQNLQL